MPGDPKQCRQHALNCMLLAKRATTEESRQTFHNLAQSWTRLAVELEGAQALLNGLNGMEFKNAPPTKPTRPRKRPKPRLTSQKEPEHPCAEDTPGPGTARSRRVPFAE